MVANLIEHRQVTILLVSRGQIHTGYSRLYGQPGNILLFTLSLTTPQTESCFEVTQYSSVNRHAFIFGPRQFGRGLLTSVFLGEKIRRSMGARYTYTHPHQLNVDDL